MAGFLIRQMMTDMTRRITEQRERDEQKMKLLGDPVALDQMAGKWAEYLSPSIKKAKGKYPLDTEAIDAAIPAGHPMKGYGRQVRESLASELANPSNRDLYPEQIVRHVALSLYDTPAAPGQGSRYLESLKHKRMADTSLWQWGDDPTVKAPPGYDAFRADLNKREQAAEAGHSWLASPADIAESAAIFAGMEGLIAGFATAGAGVPLAMATGAGIGALLETFTHPVQKLLRKTEWARARLHSDSMLDKAKVWAAQMIPELVAWPRVTKLAARAVTVPKLMAQEVAAKPSAANILAHAQWKEGFARLSADELAQLFTERAVTSKNLGWGLKTRDDAVDFLKMLTAPPFSARAKDTRRVIFEALKQQEPFPKDPPWTWGPTAAPSQMTSAQFEQMMKGFGIKTRGAPPPRGHKLDPRSEKMYRSMFNKLDDIGFEEALTDPVGPMSGTARAYGRMHSRMLADGRIPMQDAEAAVSLNFFREAKKYQKLPKKAYKELEAEFENIWRMESEALEKWPEKSLQVRAWANAIRSETLDEYGSHMAPIQRLMNARASGSAEILRETTRGTSAAKDLAIADLYPTTVNEAAELALATADAARAKHIELVRKVVKRSLTETQEEGRGKLVKEFTKAAERTEEPIFKTQVWKHPAQLKRKIEELNLSADMLDDTIDEFSERMFNKYLKPLGKEYTKIQTAEWRTFVLSRRTGEAVVERLEPLTATEVSAKITEDLDLMMQKMNIHEYNTMETLIEMQDRAMLREGRTQPVRALVPKTGQRQIGELTADLKPGKRGFWRPGAGWWDDFPTGTSVAAKKALEKELTAAEWVQRKTKPINMQEAKEKAADLIKRMDEGLEPELALEEVLDLKDRITMSEVIPEFEKILLVDGFAYDSVNEVLHSVPHSLTAAETQLKKMISLASFFAMLGLTPGAFGLFGGPSEVEAATGTAVRGTVGLLGELFRSFGRNARRVAAAEGKVFSETLAAQAKELGVLTPEIAEDATKILASQYQRGLVSKEISKNFMRKITSHAKNIKEGIRHKIMSPGGLVEEMMTGEQGFMSSPAVVKVSFQNAEYHNIALSDKVLARIMRDNKIKGEPKLIGDHFEPLTGLHLEHVQKQFHESMIEEITKQIDEIKKGKMDKPRKLDLAMAEENFNLHSRAAAGYRGVTEKFHREWESLAAQLAPKSSSFRVYMTVYDGPDFAKAPFMKNVVLSPNEMTAAGQWREWLLEYRARLEEQKVPVISGPYAPTIMHPVSRAQFLERNRHTPDAAPFMRFYSRSPDSRPLLPDFPTSMMRYIRDTERRLQNRAFWNAKWKEVERQTQHIPLLARAFKALREGVVPNETTWGNTAANWYVQFEAWKRLHLNPSAGGKHLMKMTGAMATAGIGNTLKAIPAGARFTLDRIMDLRPSKMKEMADIGFATVRARRKVIRDFQKSMIPPRNHRQRLIDMGVFGDHEYLSVWRSMWHKVQNVGSVWINFAEVIDRGITSAAGLEMAARRGMTAEQAYYGALDLMLKNNFFSREMNPWWMNDPKVRALFMFQATPYKIMERRLVQAVRAGRVGNKLLRMTGGAITSREKAGKMLSDIRGLRAAMKTTEQEMKVNLIADALRSEVDFFGTPVVNQFAKDLLITGALLGGGGSIGMNLKHHVWHVPFFSGQAYDPSLAFSPGIMAVLRGVKAYQEREAIDDEWLFTKILKKWLGPTGPMPDVIWKGKRISMNDIPEMYKDSRFRYLFAIPYKGEE